MKTLFIIALAMSINLSSFAGPESHLSQLSTVKNSYDKTKITLLEGAGKVKVFLFDDMGRKVYSQSINVKRNIILPLDLANIPFGTYVVRIQNSESSVEHVIETKSQPAKESPFKALLRGGHDDNSIKLSVYEMAEPGMTIRVMDHKNKVLHKEVIADGEPFVRKFLLDHIDKSQVYVCLTDKKGNREYFVIES